MQILLLLLLLNTLTYSSARTLDVPFVEFPMSGGNKSLSVESGQDFIVQLSDFTSTGYVWFFDDISDDSVVKYNGNKTGGGLTSPPYMNVSFTASNPGSAECSMVHVKPWMYNDPTADRGYARLKLVVS